MKLGDVVLVEDVLVGVIRYIGWVNNLSCGSTDEYIGIEIKYRSGNSDTGIQTNGEYTGYVYFHTTLSKGRFIKRNNITRQFNPEELFDFIENKSSLIPARSNDDSKIQVVIK